MVNAELLLRRKINDLIFAFAPANGRIVSEILSNEDAAFAHHQMHRIILGLVPGNLERSFIIAGSRREGELCNANALEPPKTAAFTVPREAG